MPHTTDRLVLAALTLSTVWAATRMARLELDVENRSMRSERSSGAAAESRREQLFGPDATVVLLLEPRDEGVDAEDELEEWTEALAACSAVGECLPLPQAGEGEALVAVTLKPDGEGLIAASLAEVARLAEERAPTTHRLSISGSPAAETAVAAALDAEQRRIVPLVGGVLLLLLGLVYRSPALALGAFLPAVAAIAWTGALQAALGIPVNPVTALLPPVLLAVGVAGAVHLVDAYLAVRAEGSGPERAAREAVRQVLIPALGCAATTVAGFLALLTSPIPAIERFGLLAAGGVGITALLTFAFLPAWLRCFARSERLIARAAGQARWHGIATQLTLRLARGAPGIVALVLGLTLLFGWAWTRLGVDTDLLRILPAHHPFREATARIGARLGGTETFDLLLSPPEPAGGFVALLGLQQELLALEGVAGPGGPPRRAPDGSALLTTLLEPGGSTAREGIFAEAEASARARGWSEVQASGRAVRMARDSGAIVRGEIYGLLATLLALGPGIWIVLRSVPLTLLGLAANSLPCFLLHGGLALAGRPLSVASAMIGSVILGLVVDQAIYFLHGYRHVQARRRLAVARTLQKSGRAMSVSSLVLATGFLAGLAGELSTTREFGILAAGSILTAWGANLLLVPALLLLRRR